MENNIVWRIGNGEQIYFWKHRWLPQIENLLFHAIVPLDEVSLNEKISDYVTMDGCWNWPKLDAVLPRNICEFIAALVPPSPYADHDAPA